jgi:GNAT superfamily N-acetyltransferase
MTEPDCNGRCVSRLEVRELGAGDGQVLDVVFAGLSAQSRYLRFHSPVSRLTAGARRSLMALDGRDHVALAAFVDGRPIGIVRIVVRDDGRMELAVEVVDAWHGRGVGSCLVRAARDRAVELGHRELVAEVLTENHAMRAVVRRVFPIARTTRVGPELTIVLPLHDHELGLADLIDELTA